MILKLIYLDYMSCYLFIWFFLERMAAIKSSTPGDTMCFSFFLNPILCAINIEDERSCIRKESVTY
jgi:hypothetical protein